MLKRLLLNCVLTAATLIVLPLPGTALGAGPLAYRTATATIPAYSHERAQALCPPGAEATGGGGVLRGGDYPQSTLGELLSYDATVPGAPHREAYVAGGYNAVEVPREVKATAICLRRGMSHLSSPWETVEIPADQIAGSVAATCGAGTEAIGGGGAILGPFGNTTTLFASAPTGPGGVDPTLNSWNVRARRPIDGSERTVYAQASCLDMGFRQVQHRAAGTTVASGETDTVSVRCARGFHVSGGGVGGGSLAIFASVPFDGRDRRHVPDDGWRARFGNYVIGAQDAIVTAICIR